MQKENESFWKELSKTNPISIIAFYLLTYLFGTLIISILVALTIGAKHGLAIEESFRISMSKLETIDKANLNIYYELQAYTNLFSYLLMFIIVGFIGRKYLIDDIKIFKNYKTVLLMILSAVIFTLINFGLSNLSTLIVSKISNSETSANEQLIQSMVKSGNQIPVAISVILFAPLTEELVYRASIFSLSDKLKPIFRILISGLIFSLPHMISSIGYNFGAFMVLELVYFAAGVLLATIYYIFNKNIYASTMAHMFSNAFAFIMMSI